MLANWLSNIKWVLVIAIFAGPAFAYWSFTEAQTLKRIMAEGVEATAIVDGGEIRSGRRSGTSYKIHAIWTDQAGAERAENIPISSEYAGKIIDEDDYLLIESVVVKYLANDPAAPVIVAEDGPTQVADKELMIMLGGAAGVVGLIGSAIFFLVGRKKPQPATGSAGA